MEPELSTRSERWPEGPGELADLETGIPQLGYAQAQDLLDLLRAEDSPLLGA